MSTDILNTPAVVTSAPAQITSSESSDKPKTSIVLYDFLDSHKTLAEINAHLASEGIAIKDTARAIRRLRAGGKVRVRRESNKPRTFSYFAV